LLRENITVSHTFHALIGAQALTKLDRDPTECGELDIYVALFMHVIHFLRFYNVYVDEFVGQKIVRGH
jgi:hypothetical protein